MPLLMGFWKMSLDFLGDRALNKLALKLYIPKKKRLIEIGKSERGVEDKGRSEIREFDLGAVPKRVYLSQGRFLIFVRFISEGDSIVMQGIEIVR